MSYGVDWWLENISLINKSYYMYNLSAKLYIVKRGDNLDSIAKKNGYSNWKEIYYSRHNENLRKLRTNPNLIYPGDNIYLPPDIKSIVESLRSEIKMYEKVLSSIDSQTDDIVNELKDNFSQLEKDTKVQRTSAEILLFAKSLAFGLKGVINKMKNKAGDAITEIHKLNKELDKVLYKEPLKEKLVSESLDYYSNQAPSEDDLFFEPVLKDTIDYYYSLTDPVWWSAVMTEINEKGLNKETFFTTLKQRRDSEIKKVKDSQEKRKKDLQNRISSNFKLIEELESKY
jgi:hypothetical protein